tara:strand:+ start:5661 stop:6935 length:1275 start_codon:yes stop_codon:yes gene_type:complete
MKKVILSLIIFGLFQLSYSQKKELKTIDKQIKAEEYENALNTINSIKSLVDDADNKTKAKYYYLKGMARYQNGNGSFENKTLSIKDFNESKKFEILGTKIYTSKIDNIFTELFNSFINDSRTALDLKNYKNSYKNLEAAYNVSNKDTLYLYNAALVATEAMDYNIALAFYEKLIDLGYSGVSMNYYAVEKESGKEQVFQDEKSRNFSVDVIGTHDSPRDEMANSVKIDIFRSVAAIYKTQENFLKSIEYLEEAKQIDENDINLILLESNIRWEIGEVDVYQNLISKALEIEPNNVDLIFNLGVVNADKGNFDDAISYYDKAIEIDSNYTKAYLNAAAIILEKEGPMIEEMNSLGMSTADYNRYDELKIERENLYKSAIPYLEKVYNLESDNLSAARTLKNIYSALGDIEQENRYKVIVAELENN